ncbi:MAG: hydroxyacid dehydrogenase [Reyranellaceae bacterium]
MSLGTRRRRIFVPEPLPVAALAPLDGIAEIHQGPADRACTEAELIEQARCSDAFIITSRDRITAAVINAGTALSIVAKTGARPNNVDFAAAKARNVSVIWTPAANAVSVAEHTLALILGVAKSMLESNRRLLNGLWRDFDLVGVELQGKTAGLIGFGAIGVEVARRLRAFGMSVLAYDPHVAAERFAAEGVVPAPLDGLVAQADVVSLHCALTKETANLLDARRLRSMKASAFVINTARGGLIDEAALERALREGWIAAAGLDVFAEEPPAKGKSLFRLPNVLATPHVAAFTAESIRREVQWAAEDVGALLSGRPALRWQGAA